MKNNLDNLQRLPGDRVQTFAAIAAIEYYLPENVVTTEDLAAQHPEWSIEKLDAKTGIRTRHIAAENECASDLAYHASRKLFASSVCRPEEIDFVLLCTQSPDYLLPTTACLLQDRLGIPMTSGALDFNLGCSGFVYGLGLASGLIATQQAKAVLLITAETYSKFMNPNDKNVRALFGDAAAATLIKAKTSARHLIGPFVYGTDGRGGPNLIVPTGGTRRARDSGSAREIQDKAGNRRSDDNLWMDGAKISDFALTVVPQAVDSLLKQEGLTRDAVDLFVLHQGNAYVLNALRRDLGIPPEKFQIALSHCGNTVSSTIPIALKEAEREGRLHDDALVMLVGFGVGYSWGAALVRWVKHDGVAPPS